MRLDRYLGSRLEASRQTVRHLLAARRIMLNGVPVIDGRAPISPFCRVELDGEILQARTAIHLMLHKPRGCVSATIDARNRTVLDLIDLPAKQELHIAGRLDYNTTGLMLLTNDGDWSTHIMLPARKMPKVYHVETKEEITEDYVRKFAEGVYFRYENLTTSPAQLRILTPTTAEITICEGRYHQIKRMFGFFQNEVIALHRLSIGPLTLDEALAPGAYRPLTPVEIQALR